MSITSKQSEPDLGKKSLAVRTKLIDRTAKCEEVAHRGQAALAQEVVQILQFLVELDPVLRAICHQFRLQLDLEKMELLLLLFLVVED